jgi:uncharacterized protein (TIGR02679 family)
MDKELVDECVSYFKSSPGYTRMFAALKKKWESMGRFGGRIEISNPSKGEIEAIRKLVIRNCLDGGNLSFTVSQLKKALAQTKFEGVELEDLVFAYFGKPLETNKDLKKRKEEARQGFFQSAYPDGEAKAWLMNVLETKRPPYRLMMKLYEENPAGLQKVLDALAIGMNILKTGTGLTRLAIFAAQASGDPHFFDDRENGGRMLVSYLSGEAGLEEDPKSAEERSELYYQAGLIKDDISSSCATYGLNATNLDGLPNPMFASSAREPFIASLANIASIRDASAKNPGVPIHIVENPTVFSALTDADIKRQGDLALICSNGQFNLAALAMIDRIAKSGAKLLYSGDFDPSGLLMAQRIKDRYSDQLELWRYGLDDYKACLSNVDLSKTELAKLEGIHLPELKEVAEHMAALKKAGYQESIIDRYVKDCGLE